MSVPYPILDLARSLPVPKKDYVGISGHQPGLPFQVAVFCRTPRAKVSPGFHYRYIWCYAISGAGEIVLDGQHQSLKAGQRVLVKPFVRHEYTHELGSTMLECIFIRFEIDSVSAVGQLNGVVQECATDDWVSVYVLLTKYLKSLQLLDAGSAFARLSSEVTLNLSRALEFSILALDCPSNLERTQRITAPQRLVEQVWLFARNASPAPSQNQCGALSLPVGSSAAGITRRSLAKHLAVSESTLRDAIRVAKRNREIGAEIGNRCRK